MNVTLRQAESLISSRTVFVSGNLSGTWLASCPSAESFRESDLTADITAHLSDVAAVYVVSSYGVPVAFTDTFGHVYVTAQKYSTTTTKHTNIARRALEA